MRITLKIILFGCMLASPWALAEPGAGIADEARVFRFDNGAGLHGSSTHYRFDSRHGDFYPHLGSSVSRYFVHRELSDGALHYGGTVAVDETHHYAGVTLGPATLAWFQGRGESFSKARNPLYPDLDQYFFHGGSRSAFEFRGLGASIGLGGGVSARMVYSNVEAPGAQDRHGYYAGVSRGRFEGGVYQVDRGGERVGGGLNLAFQGRRLGVRYQEMRSEYDAHVRRLSLQWNGTPRQTFAIGLEQARNGLFARDDEQRVMFRFRTSIGGPPVFNASGSGDENASEEEQGGFNRTVAIGVGVGAAAVALSSGGDSDGAPRFAVRNEAAFAVLNRVNPVSVRQNREHGGWIFRNADNTFGYTNPVAGTVSSVNIGNPANVVPQGTRASASYHTHGGPDPRFVNEQFSPQDILSDNLTGTDGYLGTPAGFMKLHDVRTGNISVVGRINN